MRAAVDLRSRLQAESLALGTGRDRCIPPGDTVARWSGDALWQRFGITRLARLTGLDRIGIPVWASVRPNSRTLSVCQGKGVDDDAARASALMEAIEVACAEQVSHSATRASRRDLEARGHRVVEFPALLSRGAVLPPADEEQAWLAACDLLRGDDVLVPAEAIGLDDTCASIYWRSTDGLASGNIMAEAVLHGLCERVERDAMTLWAVTSTAGVQRRCIDPRSLGDDAVTALVGQIEASALTLRLFNITSDIAVPVFFAVLFPDVRHQDAIGFLDVTSGSGCHPAAARAATRAITEAVQSRLTKIAATRDDFDPALYRAALPDSIGRYGDCIPRAYDGASTPNPSDKLAGVLDALRAARVEDIYVAVIVDEPGLVVTKVVVPGLENPPGRRAVAAGRRLVRFMVRQS